MSRTGAQVRGCDPAAGLPRKLSKRRLTSPWMSDMFRNGSHLSTDTNGRQRSIAISKALLWLSAGSPRPRYLFEYARYISSELVSVKLAEMIRKFTAFGGWA